jgi:hypothetical protein
MGVARHDALSHTKIAKKGKDTFPSPFVLAQLSKAEATYLVFASSFFSSAGLSGIGAASFAGSLGVAGAGSAGAAGAGGGGGGGAGSSFFPHPTNVSVKANSVMADNEITFFPITVHLLSRHCKISC